MKIWILLLVISSLLLLPLLHFGFPPSHDGEYHIIRAYQFGKTLRDGNWYPRWQSDVNNGYGSPLMNYYYPLPYYVVSLFHFLGSSFIDGFKLGLVFATFTGAVLFFLWARIFWGNLGGFVSSIIYTFSPYHIVDIYVRGAIGEVWALALFPGFLWSITKYVKTKGPKYFIASSLFLASVIFSHNILSLMFFPFAVIYIVFLLFNSLFNSKNKTYLSINCFLIIILGLSLSSIFWIPALFESEYVRGLLIYNVQEHFPELYQLLIPSWGTGFSNTGPSNQMSFQIGVVNILAVLTSIFIAFRVFKKNIKDVLILIFFVVSFFVVIFLMLSVSYPIWKYTPFFNYFQFPWRFLSLGILISAFLAGSILKFWNIRILAYSIVLLTVLLTIGYTTPAYYWEREDSYYFSRSNFMDGTNTPGNIFNTIWFREGLKRQKEKVTILEGTGKISDFEIKSTKYSFSFTAQTPVTIGVNTAYFPGWTVFLNREKRKLNLAEKGSMYFVAPKGKHSAIVKFEDTPLRKLAGNLSLISIISILVLSVKLGFDKIRR